MKASRIILLCFCISGIISCEKSKTDIMVDSIIGTRWSLNGIIDSAGHISRFPSEINDFDIVFRENGKIDLPNYCNFSNGNFAINDNDSITITNLGPATKKYCLPDIAMEWEVKFIESLISTKTYTIKDNKLIINCKENKLIFDFEGFYNTDKGKILFCTSASLMNCIFEIEVSINGEKIGTLDAGSSYSDNDCFCDLTGIGLLIHKDKGTYTYSAKELKSNSTNITNSWSGEFDVTGDSCTIIFLDIEKNSI